MIEEFDAASAANQFGASVIVLGLVLVGLVMEFGLVRWLRRLSIARSWVPGAVLFTALSGQSLFWSFVLAFSFAGRDLLLDSRITDLLRSGLVFSGIVAVTIFVVRLGTNWVYFYLREQQFGSVSLINNLLRGLGALVIFSTILSLIGVPIGPLLTVIAGSSLGLTLALRDPLANFFSGVIIIASNKIRPGDFVRLSTGEEGYVTDIRWSDTYLRQMANNLIIVPNAQMTNALVINFHRPEPRLVTLLDVAVGYGADLARVEQIAIEVAREVAGEVVGGVPDQDPLVRFNTFNDSSVRFTMVLHAQSFGDQFLIRHEFVKRFTAALRAADIPLPFPVRVLRTDDAFPAFDTPLALQRFAADGAPARDGAQPAAPEGAGA
jgi:small-conductance mechanosensitive channel